MKKLILTSIMLFACVSIFISCGGGGETPAAGGGLNNATRMIGYVYAPNGDPVPSATIYIASASANLTRRFARTTYLKASADDDSTTCDDPTASSCAVICSRANGYFEMDTSNCTGSETQMGVQKGSWQMTIDLNCTADPCEQNATFGSSGTTQWPKVAVVSGAYDRMQDVIAKIAPSAYGTVNSSGILEEGSENATNLTIIDGGATLSDSYTNFDKYLDGTNSFDTFDVVFINCGDVYEDMLDDSNVRSRLQSYVESGGRLYVTDLSYDFINQVWPSFMNFEGDVDANTPGARDAAQTGTADLTVNAAINDATMRSWLGNVTVNAADANTPGTPRMTDCQTGSATTRTGALNGDSTIPIGDFWVQWARMIGKFATETTVWISSGSGVSFDGLDNRPLTVSETIGSSGGRLFYSSYHTAESCPTLNFWPQERVLQYLVFESF